MLENQGIDLWVQEVHQGAVGLSFKVEKTLFSGRSPYQRIDVVQTHSHGALLLNDGIVMLSERDEFIYHEMIAHVALFVHPDPRRVLIIGGGDGGTAREVLKHRTVEKAVMVEIDEMVVNACREFLPGVSCALDDPRLELRIGDGVQYVSDSDQRFDVVIVDSTDPIGPAAPLFDAAFYAGVAGLLERDGILIAQAESPFYDQHIQISMLQNQRASFDRLHLFLFPTLTYPGGLWSFSYASKGLCPLKDFAEERFQNAGVGTRYYHPGIHRAAFALPVFLAEKMQHLLDPPGS